MTAVVVKAKIKTKRRVVAQCDASGYKIAARGFYTVTEKDGKTICDCCGKVVRLRCGGEYYYIPTHNVPREG